MGGFSTTSQPELYSFSLATTGRRDDQTSMYTDLLLLDLVKRYIKRITVNASMKTSVAAKLIPAVSVGVRLV